MNISPWATLHVMAWGLGVKAVDDLRSEFEPDARAWFHLSWGVRLCLAMAVAMLLSPLLPGLTFYSTLSGILSALNIAICFRCLQDDICSGWSCRSVLARRERLVGWGFAGGTFLCVALGALEPAGVAPLAYRLGLIEGGLWLLVSAWLTVSLFFFDCPTPQFQVYRPRTLAAAFFFAFLHSLLKPFEWATGVPVPAEAGEILGTLFVLTLVMKLYVMVIRVRNQKLVEALTQLHAFEAKLLQTEKLAAVGTVAAGAAHDFGNWLAIILGYADILLLDGTLASESRLSAERIQATGKRALATLRQLAGLGRSESQGGPADLRQAVEQPLDLIAKDFSRYKIEVVKRLEDVPSVPADLNLVSQVCLNLYINARDAMAASGGGVLDVSLRLQAENGQPLITVRDTGPGIAEDFKPRIFQPFQTTKGEKGTGLGLSASRSSIRAMGGDMSFESAAGRGAVFWVSLPLKSAGISEKGAVGKEVAA